MPRLAGALAARGELLEAPRFPRADEVLLARAGLAPNHSEARAWYRLAARRARTQAARSVTWHVVTEASFVAGEPIPITLDARATRALS